MSLRELKKAKTRKQISDIATKLFIERGYTQVTVEEIARLAEVSVPTLFKYFPSKESLVFDEDKDREQRIVETVKKRAKGQSILDALMDMALESPMLKPENQKEAKTFFKFIGENPALDSYSRMMWSKFEEALADAIHEDKVRPTSLIEAKTIAHFVLGAFHRATHEPDPKSALIAMFDILRKGWNA